MKREILVRRLALAVYIALILAPFAATAAHWHLLWTPIFGYPVPLPIIY